MTTPRRADGHARCCPHAGVGRIDRRAAVDGFRRCSDGRRAGPLQETGAELTDGAMHERRPVQDREAGTMTHDGYA